MYARHFRGSIHGEQVLVALRHFRRRINQPLVVVWDRLNAHRAKPVQAFVAAHPADYRLEWLPPYAPDLNPEGLCNGAVKRDLLEHHPPRSTRCTTRPPRLPTTSAAKPSCCTASSFTRASALTDFREAH